MRTIFQNKAVAYTIVFLLIANLALITWFAFFRGDCCKAPKKKMDVTSYVKKDLKFDEKQMKDFEVQKKSNKEKMRSLFDSTAIAKDSFYSLVLVENLDDSILYDKVLAVMEKQRVIEMEFFRQFKNLRQMCTPAQQKTFDSSFLNLVRKMYRPKPEEDKSRIKN